MVIGLIACLAACKKEQPQSPIPDSPASLQKLFNPAYQISTDSIHRMIRSYLDENKQVTPWDSALVAYYQEKDEFFWLMILWYPINRLHSQQTLCYTG